jgi:hypothetical protein
MPGPNLEYVPQFCISYLSICTVAVGESYDQLGVVHYRARTALVTLRITGREAGASQLGNRADRDNTFELQLERE